MMNRSKSSAKRQARLGLEHLSVRDLLSNLPLLPDVAIQSATQKDAHTVEVAYQVNGSSLAAPVTLNVYRSVTPTIDASAEIVASATIVPSSTLDVQGQSAADLGSHVVKVSAADGLGLNPSHPYVVVAANVDHSLPESNYTNDTASYRIYTVGVITHGGIQPKNWVTSGPPWESHMARSLKAEGYDVVIPFNWVAMSNSPGAAKGVAPYLLAKVKNAASTLPQNAPIDLQFIGHSEGAVVNSEVLKSLANSSPPNIASGYIEETMLDPHAASSAFGGPQYSVTSGFLGSIAKSMINKYQHRANDPLVAVPSNVNRADVFYQQTAVNHTHSSNNGIYNLWGQVPVQGDANYYDLTHDGISHGGTYAVYDWYQQHVVPTLADGSPQVAAQTVTIDQNSIKYDNPNTTISGTAPAGSTVTLNVLNRPLVTISSTTTSVQHVGTAVAGSDGRWTLTTTKPINYASSFVATTPYKLGEGTLPMKAKAIVGNPIPFATSVQTSQINTNVPIAIGYPA